MNMDLRIGLPILLTLVSLTAPAQQKPKPSHELLWEITGNGISQPSYLFGTYHTFNKKYFHFSDSTMICLDRADVFAMEVNPDSISGEVFGMVSKYLGQDMQGVDEAEEREEAPAMFRQSFSAEPIPAEQRYHTFIDMYLYNLARTHGKKVVGLEEADAQVAMAYDYIYDRKRGLEREEEMRRQAGYASRLEQLYLAGDLVGLDQLLLEAYESDTAAYSAIFTIRNHYMADKIDTLVGEESVFIAVGSGHLPGQEGLIELLRAKGYRLRPVQATFRRNFWKYRFDSPEVPLPVFSFRDPGMGVEMDFPMLVTPFSVEIPTGGKICMGIDLGNMRTGFVMSMLMPNINANYLTRKLMMEGMIASFRERGLEITLREKMNVGEIEGEQLVVCNPQAKMYSMLGIFIRDKDILMIMLVNGNTGMKDEGLRESFATLRLSEPARMEAVVFRPPTLGFEASWYGQPYFGEKRSVNMESEMIERTWTWVNVADGMQASVMMILPTKSMNYNDEGQWRENLREVYEESAANEVRDTMFLGNLALRLRASENGRLSEEKVSFLHQGIIYVLRVRYLSGTPRPLLGQQFFDAFKLGQHAMPVDWAEQEFAPGVRLKLPPMSQAVYSQRLPEQMADDYQLWIGRDPASNYLYMLAEYTFSQYKNILSEDTLAFEIVRSLGYRSEQPSLEKVVDELDGDIHYFRLEGDMPKSDMKQVAVVAISGRHVWTLLALVPQDTRTVSPFFAPFLSMRVPPYPSRLTDPLGALLEAARQPDPDWDLLLESMEINTWSRHHAIQLLEACATPFADEETMQVDWQGKPERDYFREAILRQFATEDSLQGHAGAIAQIYPSLPAITEMRSLALFAMLADSTPEMLGLMLETLLADTTPVWQDFSFDQYYLGAYLQNEIGSHKRLLSTAAPYIRPMLSKKATFTKSFVRLAIQASDSGVYSMAELEGFRREWVDSAEAQYRRNEEDNGRKEIDAESMKYYGSVEMAEMLEWLAYLPAEPMTASYFRKHLKDPYLNHRFWCLVGLARYGEQIPDSVMEELAAQDYLRVSLWKELKKAGRENALPSRYLTQAEMGIGELCAYIAEEHGEVPTFCELRDERIFIRGGNAVKVYMYEYGWGGDETYLGFAGPYSESAQDLGTDGSSTFYNYTTFDPSEKESHWQEVIEFTELKAME